MGLKDCSGLVYFSNSLPEGQAIYKYFFLALLLSRPEVHFATITTIPKHLCRILYIFANTCMTDTNNSQVCKSWLHKKGEHTNFWTILYKGILLACEQTGQAQGVSVRRSQANFTSRDCACSLHSFKTLFYTYHRVAKEAGCLSRIVLTFFYWRPSRIMEIKKFWQPFALKERHYLIALTRSWNAWSTLVFCFALVSMYWICWKQKEFDHVTACTSCQGAAGRVLSGE